MASVLVIGAGIVGLAVARALQKADHAITLVDPQPPGSQASYGNAGLIAGSAVVPEARPDLVWRLPRLIGDRDGPLSVRLRYAPRMLRFARHVARAARPAEVERVSIAMAALSLPAYDDWMALLDGLGDARALFCRNGALYLYRSPNERRAAERANVIRRRRGMRLADISGDEVRQFAPALRVANAQATLSLDSGHVSSPKLLAGRLATALERDGARFVTDRVVGFAGAGDAADAAVASAGPIAADHIVICAGARSRALAQEAGTDVPLDTERGYHLDLPIAPHGLGLPVIVPALGVALTPLSDTIRIAGLVEFAGLHAPPSEAMFGRLERRARALFGDVDLADAPRWMGLRPSLPDGLPIIDRSPRYQNVWGAFGHGQMGLTQAARTALAVCGVIEGAPARFDLAPYRWRRFA